MPSNTFHSPLYTRSLQLVLAAMTLFLCFSAHVVADNKLLKVGVVLCLTGACKQTGTHALNGLMLARDEINSKGGILGRKVELVVQDSREAESPSHAVSAYRQLRLDPEISLFVGTSWSIGGLALAPIAARDPVILTAPSIGLEAFNQAGPNIFNLWPHDSVSTKALAHFAIDKGWRKVAIISNSHPWQSELARIFREEYKALGGVETNFFEIPSSDSTQLRSLAAKIKLSKPDVVFLTNYSQLGLTGRAFKEVGLERPTMTILLEDAQIEIAHGALDGIIFVGYEDSAQDFVERYRAAFSLAPDLGADTGYDILYFYKNGIERLGSTDPKLLQKVLLESELLGASGTIRFDSKGGVIKKPVFKRLLGSKRVPVDVSSEQLR